MNAPKRKSAHKREHKLPNTAQAAAWLEHVVRPMLGITREGNTGPVGARYESRLDLPVDAWPLLDQMCEFYPNIAKHLQGRARTWRAIYDAYYKVATACWSVLTAEPARCAVWRPTPRRKPKTT